jgi:FkbM family methyltransferase
MRLRPRQPDDASLRGGIELATRLDDLAADPLVAADVIRVETKIGPVLVHAADRVMTPFIREYREWEPDEAAWLTQELHLGATMLDVGANIGYFSLLAAQTVGPSGRVIAIEPERRNLRVLRHNVWQHDTVTIFPVAAWDERTTLELHFNEDNAGDHQVHPERDGGSQGVLVPALPLDEVLRDVTVDVVKIDTQGADHHVIAGLKETLRANPQARLLVEFWLDSMDERGDRGSDVLAGYRSLGRPIALLGEAGSSTSASDEQILAAADAAGDRFVNLVIGPA